MLGRIAEIAVIAFAVLIAINQVGIATDLVNILFIGIVAAVALALGLAFGLGGREVAGQVTQDWYDRSKEVSARAQAQMAKGSRRRRQSNDVDNAPELLHPRHHPAQADRSQHENLPGAGPSGAGHYSPFLLVRSEIAVIDELPVLATT